MSTMFDTRPDFGFYISTPAPLRERVRVLVAEDDPVQAKLLTLFLDRLGVASVHVCDGLHAIEAVKADDFAMVLMDILMPMVDGAEATRAIRRWEETMGHPRLPIIAVTASVMRDECERYLKAGMDDVLFKPFSAHELRALLFRYLPATQWARNQPNG